MGMVDGKAQLRAEAAAMDAVEESRPLLEAAAEAADQDQLQPAVVGAVQVITDQLCDRYRYTRLETREIHTLAGALLNVARVYGLLDRADPKIMALLTLGGVSATVFANRRRLPPPEKENDDTPAAAAA